MENCCTIREFINVIYHINRLKEENKVISKEVKKAFKKILQGIYNRNKWKTHSQKGIEHP